VIADQAVVEVSISGVNPTTTPILATYANGTYSASYTPHAAGADSITVTMAVNGQAAVALGTSPYTSTVSPGSYDSASTSLTTNGIINSPLDFIVTLFDIDKNRIPGLSLTASVTNPTGATAPLTVADQGNGDYAIAYTPNSVGTYTFNVGLSGPPLVSLTGFPMNVVVSDPTSIPVNLSGEFANGFFDYFGSVGPTLDSYSYWSLAWDGTSSANNHFSWDITTNTWLQIPGEFQVLLGDDGIWAQVTQDLQVGAVNDAAGSAMLENRNGNVVYERFTLQAKAAESLQGKHLNSYISAGFQSGLVPDAIFSPGAMIYGFDVVVDRDSYLMDCGSVFRNTQPTYLPNGIDTCSGVTDANAAFYTTLVSMYNISGLANSGPFLPLESVRNVSSQEIEVEIMAVSRTDQSGEIIFYHTDYSTPTVITRKEIARGKWGLTTSSLSASIRLLAFSMPAAVIADIGATAGEILAPNRFYTLWDSAAPPGVPQAGAVVRMGEFTPFGKHLFSPTGLGVWSPYNSIAAKDILNYFHPGIGLQKVAAAGDSDGDGVLDTIDAFPNDPSADSDVDSDGIPDQSYYLTQEGIRLTTDNVIVSDNDDDNDGILDAQDTCPFVSDPTNNPASCVKMNGAYVANSTVNIVDNTGSTGVFVGACNYLVGDSNRMYHRFEDKGTYLLVDGYLRIPFDHSTNSAHLTFVERERRPSPVPSDAGPRTYIHDNQITLNLLFNPTNNSFSGTFDTLESGLADANNVLKCSKSEIVNLAFAYQHNGTEQYSGRYGVETPKRIGDYQSRNAFEVEFAVDGTNRSLQLAYLDKTGVTQQNPTTYPYSSFNPDNGGYAIKLASSYSRINGQFNEIVCENTILYGSFVADPAAPGVDQVMMVGESLSTERVYSNEVDTVVCDSSRSPSSLYSNNEEFYAKLVQPNGFLAQLTYDNGTQILNRAIVGLKNPPLISPDNGPLYLNVTEASGGTSICTRTFADLPSGSGGYANVTSNVKSTVDPTAIISSQLEFQDRNYGRTHCQDAAGLLATGGTYTLSFEVLSAGPDGVMQTADDVSVSQFVNWVADGVGTANGFNGVPDLATIYVNGANPVPGTGVTHIYGVFNPYLPMPFNWMPISEGEQYYRVSISTAGNIHVHDQAAMLTGQGESMIVPPGSFSQSSNYSKNGSIVQIVARKQDPTYAPPAEIRSRSQQFELHSGLYGSVNWTRANNTSGVPDILIDVGANSQGVVTTCNITNVTNYSCLGLQSYLILPSQAANAYATLVLYVSDPNGGLGTLNFVFSNSAYASVSYNGVADGTAVITAPKGVVN